MESPVTPHPVGTVVWVKDYHADMLMPAKIIGVESREDAVAGGLVEYREHPFAYQIEYFDITGVIKNGWVYSWNITPVVDREVLWQLYSNCKKALGV